MSRLVMLCRRMVLACCLFPASFICYPSLTTWLSSLQNGKSFLRHIVVQIDSLLITINTRSLFWRICAGIPLRFARKILTHGTIISALKHSFCSPKQRVSPEPVPVRPLPKPACITLSAEVLHNQDTQQGLQQVLDKLSARPVSIEEHSHSLLGKDLDFSNTTTAVVAHWDPEGRIDPYVQHMCAHFKSLGWRVVLASAAQPVNVDTTTCSQWVDAIVYRTCSGYDFTSWKAALTCLPSLLSCSELILCNDSVFGAIGSYEPMHSQMATLPCDFWGITESYEGCRHLQSFHLVFRSTALTHPAFTNFFERVPLSESRERAILCEMSLTSWLASHGLQPAAFAPFDTTQPTSTNPSCESWLTLLDAGVPLLKRELLQKNTRNIPLSGWGKHLVDRGYPLQLILNYFERLQKPLDPLCCYGNSATCWPPNVCALEKRFELSSVRNTALDSPYRIGVFFHIFYPELADEMLDCVDHLPATAYIHVSTDSETKQEQLLATFSRRGYASRSEIKVFPNKGWDIAPFLVGYHDAISQYDLILRMHSKRSLHLPESTGEQWRNRLYTALAGSPERIHAIVKLFENNPSLGMACPPLEPYYAHCVNFGGNFVTMQALLKQHGVLVSPDMPIDFPMGSMFWCRPKALEPWLSHHFSFDDFSVSANIDTERDGTLAHALERLFFFGCGLADLTWTRLPEHP